MTHFSKILIFLILLNFQKGNAQSKCDTLNNNVPLHYEEAVKSKFENGKYVYGYDIIKNRFEKIIFEFNSKPEITFKFLKCEKFKGTINSHLKRLKYQQYNNDTIQMGFGFTLLVENDNTIVDFDIDRGHINEKINLGKQIQHSLPTSIYALNEEIARNIKSFKNQVESNPNIYLKQFITHDIKLRKFSNFNMYYQGILVRGEALRFELKNDSIITSFPDKLKYQFESKIKKEINDAKSNNLLVDLIPLSENYFDYDTCLLRYYITHLNKDPSLKVLVANHWIANFSDFAMPKTEYYNINFQQIVSGSIIIQKIEEPYLKQFRREHIQSKNQFKLNISDYPKGWYVISFSGDGYSTLKKIIKIE